MTSNVAFERSFAELSNGHGFSMVRVFTLAKIIKTSCSVFFCAMVMFEGIRVLCFEMNALIDKFLHGLIALLRSNRVTGTAIRASKRINT